MHPSQSVARPPVHRLAVVGSTNAETAARLERGTAPPFWLVADEQTAGRGRSGRDWSSPPGNLYASLAWPVHRPPAETATLAFVAALAVHDTVTLALGEKPGVEVLLKWPNDVLCGGAKISGILLESRSCQGADRVVVIGCGINCGDHPVLAERRTTALKALGGVYDPQAVFDLLAPAFAERLGQWDVGGFAAIRDDWLARAAGRGQPLEIRLPGETFVATFDGLDDDGALRARLPDGRTRHIAAGEVLLPGETGQAAAMGAA